MSETATLYCAIAALWAHVLILHRGLKAHGRAVGELAGVRAAVRACPVPDCLLRGVLAFVALAVSSCTALPAGSVVLTMPGGTIMVKNEGVRHDK